jgi:hypothetical protein
LSPQQLFGSRHQLQKAAKDHSEAEEVQFVPACHSAFKFESRMTIHITPVPPVTLASVPGPQGTTMLGAKMTGFADLAAKISAGKRQETLARQRSRKGR